MFGAPPSVFVLATLVAAAAAMRVRRMRVRHMPSLPWMSASATGMGEGTLASPRVAATDAQAEVLRSAWASDAEISAYLSCGTRHFATRECVYHDEQVPLHGRLVWGQGGDSATESPRPGVLLVHTAVGPSDIFLLWRAHTLATRGYVVLIVDCFGDASGLGWDPAWAAPRRQLFVDDRPLLAQRMLLALRALTDASREGPLVDPSRLAAVGFCFGGRAVLDLLRSDPSGLCGVVSFHGILDANPPAAGITGARGRALLCHAQDDPFVPPAAVQACIAQLGGLGVRWDLHSYGGGALHGFTNPAQALNEKPQFGYDAHAAGASWAAAMYFLERVLA